MFQVGWRKDHVAIVNNQLRLRLDDTPCSSNTNLCSGQAFASGEYSSIQLFGAGQVDFYAQPAKGSGVITGLFLYTGASDQNLHDEIDIEFLGKDTTVVQFNYFVQGIGGHEVLVPLGFDAAQAIHHYTIRWDDKRIVWLVDGMEKHRVSGVALPSSHMRIFANIWAATGIDLWSGAFAYANVPVDAFVDSIRYTPVSVISAVTPSSASSYGGCITTWLDDFSMLFCFMMLSLFGIRRLI